MSAVLEIPALVGSGGAWNGVTKELKARDYALIPGQSLAAWCGVTSPQWEAFADYWNRLTLDQFMGDGGTYRLRRYGQFETDSDGTLRQLPHGPYEQPSYINRLNGGIAREFDPLEEGFARHTVLHGILNALLKIVNSVESSDTPWNVRLHPYRIVAKPGVAGQPTPEGLHRDGVHYIVSMMVKRTNVVGGESSFTDQQGTPLASLTLMSPMDLALSNDERTMHAVTPVTPLDPAVEAYRDVLVIAFTKVFHD